MAIHRYLLFTFLIFLFSECSDEVTSRTYPRLLTTDVSDIYSPEAFKAEIIFINEKIPEHGFLWDSNPILYPDLSNTIDLGPATSTGTFTSSFNATLEDDKQYYMCSYARSSSNRIVLGNVVQFKKQ